MSCMRCFIYGLIGLLVLTTGNPVLAQFSDQIDLNFTTDRDVVTVGDPIQLTLEVKHPEGYEVVLESVGETWGDFDVWSQSEAETERNVDGSLITRQVLEVALFDSGTFRTPTWRIILRDPQGNVRERVVPQVSITVESVLTAGDTELRDLKPQFVLPVPPIWPWIVLLSLIGLSLIAMLVIFYLWYRRQMSTPPEILMPAPAIDVRPPHEVALAELARIEALDLPGQGRYKEYYTLISDCMRRYLVDGFQIPAIDLTTSETQKRLAASDLPPALGQRLVVILLEADLVKFARFTPEDDEAEGVIAQARYFVEASMPRLESELATESPSDRGEGPPASPVGALS